MKNEIYKITNNVNNKIYIGLTIQGARTRFLHHLYEARSGSTFPIHRAIRKHGEENFNMEVLISVEAQEELKILEKAYILEYKANNRKYGYNMTEGGDGTFGRLHSEETKDKIRQKAIGRKMSEKSKQRMSLSHSKNKNEEWYIENKRKAAFAFNSTRTNPIEIYNLDGELVKRYEKVVDAANDLDISVCSIYRAIKNENKIIKNYKFKKVLTI